MARREDLRSSSNLLDQHLCGTDAATALSQGGLPDDLKKALAERALNDEMDHHFAGEDESDNDHNSFGHKTVLTETEKLELSIPDKHK